MQPSQQSKAPEPWQWLCALVLTTIIFVATVIHSPHLRAFSYRALVNRHSMANSTISSTECSDHGRVFYKFVANGKTYSGDTYRLDHPCDSVRAGESLAIFYDPVDPTVNTNMYPAAAYHYHKTELLIGILMSLFVLCMSFFPLIRNQIRSGMPVTFWKPLDGA